MTTLLGTFEFYAPIFLLGVLIIGIVYFMKRRNNRKKQTQSKRVEKTMKKFSQLFFCRKYSGFWINKMVRYWKGQGCEFLQKYEIINFNCQMRW